DPERVDVRTGIHVLSGGLLGTHVMRGPDHHALRGELADGRLLRGLRDPEVGHEHVARAVEQDVVGLYIAVHDAVQVCVAQRVRHLPRDPGGIPQREALMLLEQLAERRSVEAAHDDVEDFVLVASDLVDRHDVGVLASRTNRSASPGDGVRPRSRTFTATSWPSSWSRTRNTAANPPSPRTSPTVNFLPRAFWRRRRSVVRSSDMADAKPRNLRRVALGTSGVVLAWLFAVWPPPVWWRDHWPRETAMMREETDWRTGGRAVGGAQSARPAVRPTDLENISPVLQRMVIIAEDSRFRSHVGIDPAEIADALGVDRAHGFWSAVGAAWRHRDRLRGASTITQQVAKNLYLSSSRNPIRKV